MKIKVNATRMQLLLLKRRSELARRGHKLLKDKLDGLVQRFLSTKKEYVELYEKLEPLLGGIFSKSSAATSFSLPHDLDPGRDEITALEIKTSSKNIMGVIIPNYHLEAEQKVPALTAGRSVELFEAVKIFSKILPDLVTMASRDKAVRLLAKQIIETRRRVNALEYILIPELFRNAKEIRMKLEEYERSSRTVLLKL
ncbi:MAG: V-type ATP synthase subunit D [Candidatus Margulisiibacteriota bacterium]